MTGDAVPDTDYMSRYCKSNAVEDGVGIVPRGQNPAPVSLERVVMS